MKCAKCSHKLEPGKMRCPYCNAWNMVGENENNACTLDEVVASDVDRIQTGPWDDAFGGGIVRDSSIFLSGEPGAGKSTCLLQLAKALGYKGGASHYGRVLYIAREESAGAIKARATRFGYSDAELAHIVVVTRFKGRISGLLKEQKPLLTILDSLQSLVGLGPGHLDDAVEVLDDLKEYAIETKSPAVVVSQVNKELDFASEMALQHLVDATFMFTVEKKTNYRVLCAVKNRHGGILPVRFVMTEKGLVVPEEPTSEVSVDSTEFDKKD